MQCEYRIVGCETRIGRKDQNEHNKGENEKVSRSQTNATHVQSLINNNNCSRVTHMTSYVLN